MHPLGPISRREFVALSGAALAASRTSAQAAEARFSPNWESLAGGYGAPEWFRNAKFGIWAHWSVQCVPEFGDWYARKMYLQGDPTYAHHVATYGHPSQFGFLELVNRWKAEHWDPEALMRRYVAAGAKYFVAMANHHDNFDTFASRHHAWNATRVGPKKDIVGLWAKVARAHGLKFGVSNHSAHAWHWFQPAYGYDAEGPLNGVRYDAYRLTKADGRGTWWEGLDPQDLYGGRNLVIPDGVASIADMNAWHAANDGQWREDPPPMNPAFVKRWKLRALDLIDSYRPDLVYFDDSELPLGQAGLDVVAHYYNLSRGDRPEVVVNAKKLLPAHRPAVVEDVERGFRNAIAPLPWQTDTCIGDWHYSRPLFERHGYKSAAWVARALCDIVAKNGNLLLSVPLKPDGRLDADEEAFLDAMAVWMKVNGEAIFATRPWIIFGEGPDQAEGGMFTENKQTFSAADIRFTRKGGVLYAQVLGWPEGGQVRIRSLAVGSPYAPGAIERVEFLGSPEPLRFARDGEALTVTLPAWRGDTISCGLKIFGPGLA